MKQKITIILADDHSVLRAGLKLLLNNEIDMQVVGEAANGAEVLRLLEKQKTDLLIMDLSMPQMGGLECLREIRSRNFAVKTLILSMHEDDEYLVQALQAGALGYVKKSAVDTELFDAIRTIAKGRIYLNASKAELLLRREQKEQKAPPADDPYTILTFRERQVLKYMARGYSLSKIAERLCISVKTVDTHKTRMMEKLSMTEKTELVAYALRYGFLHADKE